MIDMKNIYKCESCLRRQGNICRVSQEQIDLNDEACRWHAGQDNVERCVLCGAGVLRRDSIIYNEDNLYVVCGKCSEKIGTCATCICIKECAFETDPSPIPQVVQKQIRQGPMVQIVQVMNPDRIAITCKMGCECWDAETETCFKQTCGTCGKYKIVWED